MRRLAAFVGVMCLLAQFSTAFHLLLVSHVRCAEHAEWVTAEPGQAAAHVHTQAETASNAVLGAPGDGEHHEHEHCVLCSERRNGALPGSSTAASTAAIDGGLVLRPGPTASSSSARLYLSAPKTSPPV